MISRERFPKSDLHFPFQVCGLLLVMLGAWLHLSQDRLPYSYLLRDADGQEAAPIADGTGGRTATGAGDGAVGGRRKEAAVISLEAIPFVLMGIGGFLASMSFLGCCGACSESVCFLGFVRVFLLLIFLIYILKF